MMKEIATVVKVEQGGAWVECQRLGGCSACSAQSQCGTNALGKLIPSNSSRFYLSTLTPLKIGQQVEIALPERSFFTILILLYGLPLLVLVISTLFTQNLNEIAQGAVILLCTLASFSLLPFLSKRLQKSQYYQVVILRVVK